MYLPSNACQHVYPDNTPSDYKTRLDHNIHLEGAWEVGVESIFYSSHIELKDEKAEVYCNVKAVEKRPSSFKLDKFAFKEDIKWNRRIEIKPHVFATDPNNLDEVLETLNVMNYQLVVDHDYYAFRFTKHSFHLRPELKNFFIFMTPRLKAVLGFPPDTRFGSHDKLTQAKYRKPGTTQLTREDYLLKILYADPQDSESRFDIKPKGVTFKGGEGAFLTLWKEKVLNRGFIASFKKKKLIIDNYDDDLVILFSHDLAKVVGHEKIIIGRSTTWGLRQAQLEKGHSSENWYILTYLLRSIPLEKEFNYQFTVDVFPWKFSTMTETMKGITEQVEKALRGKLKTLYVIDYHRFTLSLGKGGYCKLDLGSQLSIDFSENLYRLFGLKKETLQRSEIYGMRNITNGLEKEQQLFLLSNISKATAYGQEQLQVLQTFLHKRKNVRVLVKRFQPIIYLPLITNNIDMIEMKLTNEDYEPININDCTTIVCLYFRKVREKTMM